jgi:hypothetical protein
MDTWRGHFPITHFVLRALLIKQNWPDAALSSTEAMLLAACQFWAAAARRQLPHYLGSEPLSKLTVAVEAFSAIGAVRVASSLRVAVGDCPDPLWVRQEALDLEARLLDTEDAVDHLIAQFALAHFADSSSDERQTSTVALAGDYKA